MVRVFMAMLLTMSTTALAQSLRETPSSEASVPEMGTFFTAAPFLPHDNLGGKREPYFHWSVANAALATSAFAPGGSRCCLIDDAQGGGSATPLTNDDVIKLAKTGIDEQTLVAIIREAKAVKFDLRDEGDVNELLANGVTSKVLAAMRQRTQEMPAKPPSRFRAALEKHAPAGYWAAQGLMLVSFVAAVETTQSCINKGSCTAIPSPLRTSGAMYAVGLPVVAGAAYLSYYLKKHENRWWYVPSLVVGAGGVVLTTHSARIH